MAEIIHVTHYNSVSTSKAYQRTDRINETNLLKALRQALSTAKIVINKTDDDDNKSM